MGQVITVASGKGGVGKSTITAGLGKALAKAGYRVLVIDADAGLRGLDLLLGLENQAVHDLADVLGGRKRLSEAMIRQAESGALFFLAGPLTGEQLPGRAEQLQTLFTHTGDAFDYILLDSPSGLGVWQQELAKAADLVLLVATPDEGCMRAVARTSSVLQGKQKLIINCIQPDLIKKGKAPNIDHIIDTVAVPLIGLIPQGDVQQAIANIASRLDGLVTPLYRFW